MESAGGAPDRFEEERYAETLEKTIAGGFKALSFSGPLEQKFRDEYFERSLTHFRAGLGVGVFLWFAFAGFDFLMSPPRRDLALALRLVPLPYALFLFWFSGQSAFRQWFQFLQGLLVLVTGSMLMGIIAIHDGLEFIFHQGSMWLLIIPFYTVFRIRFYRATVYTWLLTFLYMYFFGVWMPTPPEVFAHNTAIMGAMNLFGMFAAYTMEYYERRNFLQTRLIDIRRNEAEEATRLKDNFVSLVSHDLRSPLGAIISMLQLLRVMGGEDQTESKAGKLIGRTRATAVQMAETIDQLLNISRLQTGKLKPEKLVTDMRRLCFRFTEQLTYPAEKKGITIENRLPDNLRLSVDQTLIGQVVQNLVSNAIKFCGKDDTITLYQPEGEPHTIAVKDSGNGIPGTILHNLFRHDIRTTTKGTAGEVGTGLGLPYCTDIMAAHGGKLEVESQPGKGAVFYLRFLQERSTVLFMDPHPVQRSVEAERIRHALPVEVVEVDKAETALEMLERLSVHVVVACVEGRTCPGAELVRMIREGQRYHFIPLVVTLRSDDKEVCREMDRLGVNACLPANGGGNAALLEKLKRFVS